MEHGADIVLHSATKFLGGHGTTLGGVVVESGKFNWGNGKFPRMTELVASYGGLKYWENFGEYAFCTRLRVEQLRDIGAVLSPHSAFLLLQGVETLPQRMDGARGERAEGRRVPGGRRQGRVGELRGPAVAPAPRARAEVPARGARRGVRVRGARRPRRRGEVRRVGGAAVSHLANVGDARTLVIHPASTTHQQLSDDQLRAGGVGPDLVRLSVGLEDVDDILWDIDQALDQAGGAHELDRTDRPRPPAILLPHRVGDDGRRFGEPGAAELLRGDLPALVEPSTDVHFVNPRLDEMLGQPVYPSLAELPDVPTWSACSASTMTCPVWPRRSSTAGARTLWLQLGLWHEPVADRGAEAGPGRGDEPVREDRARPVRRWPAPGRFRHRRDQLPQALTVSGAPDGGTTRRRRARLDGQHHRPGHVDVDGAVAAEVGCRKLRTKTSAATISGHSAALRPPGQGRPRRYRPGTASSAIAPAAIAGLRRIRRPARQATSSRPSRTARRWRPR